MSQLIRSYTQMVALMSQGDLSRHLDGELTRVIDALETMTADSGKASITLTIDFKYELGRIDISAKAPKVTLPETVRFMRTPFWAIEGALSVQHPNQIDMFSSPRAVDTARDVGSA